MKIDFNEEEVSFLKETLAQVDKRSYDPVYKNTIDRISIGSFEDRSGNVTKRVLLEEFEVYTLIEALQDRAEHLNSNDDSKNKCENLIKSIHEKTGLSL